MKKILSIIFVVACAMCMQAREYTYTTVEGDPLNARIYTLDNGLTVFLTQNPEKPVIQTVIAVRAGAQNDPFTSTGLAHYLEHIMFKGTTHYGTTDYERELPNLVAIDSLYELYGQTEDAAERRAIYHQIDSFSYEGSKIAIANEFDKLMSVIGATGVNAFTSTDQTCYHEVIPAGELRRWAMIESDRFQNLVVRGFHTELEAVYEEFNLYSTRDQDKVMQAVNNLLFPNIPYRQHTIIGTQEHLKNPSLKNIKQFYNTYYRPNNVAICLAGDLDFEHTIAIVDQYFGAWQPNTELPEFVAPLQQPSSVVRDTVVYGTEAPMVWLAWQLPSVRHEDMDALEVMDEILCNGKCGLLDLNVEQRQLLLGCDTYLDENADYSTYHLIGVPKQGQSLQQARDILLAEIEKIQRGEFSEELLKGVIANARLHELYGMQNNRNRAFAYVHSFINGIPYEDVAHSIDRLSKVTKEDVVDVARRYFSTGYACVYKQQGQDVNPAKVDKPAITPIEMNREVQSQFLTEIAAMQSEPLQPQFLDFDRDLMRSTLANGQEYLYCKNKENDIFRLSFAIDRGINDDPALDLAQALMPYLGTDRLSAEQLQTALYMLAAEMSMSVDDDCLTFSIFGLQENMAATLSLLEDWVLGAQPDDQILRALIADNIKAHNDAKSDQRSCFTALNQCGYYGLEAVRRSTLTPQQMKRLKSADLLARVRALIPSIARVTYFGPMDIDALKTQLDRESRFVAQGRKELQLKPNYLRKQVIDRSEVWIAPYKANNIYFIGYANWGEVYSPKDEVIISLFNEYFDGSMGSIVFQEMREARALCYSSGARYRTAPFAGENNMFMTYIISQNDKLQDCIEAFDSICNHLPLSPAAFEQAKMSMLKQIEQRRYVRWAPISSYLSMRRRGWDHDYYEDIYREIPHLTLEDVVAFQKEHVANRTYRYMVLGNEKELDMKYLKSRGKIRRLKLKDIFVY